MADTVGSPAHVGMRLSSRTIALVMAVLVFSLGWTGPSSFAASPKHATIRWGGVVRWSGGPLETLARDDFFLDIRVPPSPDPARERFVDISISPDQHAVALRILAPGSTAPSECPTTPESAGAFCDRERGYGGYPRAARLLRPRPGVWRVGVVCSLRIYVGPAPDICDGARYRATATTGTLRVPHAVAHHAGGRAIRSNFDASVRLFNTRVRAFEPTLGITKRGWILFETGSGAGENLVRSRDGGRTWENASPRAGPVYLHGHAELDPYLYVDKSTSRAFTLDNEVACSAIAFSDDGGSNWTPSNACGHSDHENVFTGPPVRSSTVGYPNVVYYCAANGGQGDASTASTCSKSLDGGLTFVPTGSPAFVLDPTHGQSLPNCNGLPGPGAVGPDGTVYLPKGWCGEPYIAISHDEGLTWTRVRVARDRMWHQLEHEAAVAVDRDGVLYYTWIGVTHDPYLAISRNGGRTWSKPMSIAPPGLQLAWLPAIDVGGTGKVAVAYMGTHAGSSGLNGYITISANALARDPTFYTAPVNDPTDPLTPQGACTTRCEAAGDFFDVVVAPDGTPYAAFVDACEGPDHCDDPGFGVMGRLVGGPSLR